MSQPAYEQVTPVGDYLLELYSEMAFNRRYTEIIGPCLPVATPRPARRPQEEAASGELMTTEEIASLCSYGLARTLAPDVLQAGYQTANNTRTNTMFDLMRVIDVLQGTTFLARQIEQGSAPIIMDYRGKKRPDDNTRVSQAAGTICTHSFAARKPLLLEQPHQGFSGRFGFVWHYIVPLLDPITHKPLVTLEEVPKN